MQFAPAGFRLSIAWLALEPGRNVPASNHWNVKPVSREQPDLATRHQGSDNAMKRTELNSASTNVSAYIAKAQKLPTLSREEEHECALRFRNGDRKAGVQLIEANVRYVVAIALSYRRYGVRIPDLISEGNVGLMTALGKFDPERGTRFVTYAAHWIRAFILDHVIRAYSIVGVGAGALRSKVFFRLRRERARIAAETTDPALAMSKLAERFGTTPEKIAMLAQRLDARDLSVDIQVHDEGTATVLDTMVSPMPSQEERFLASERGGVIESRVRAAVAELDPRERFIVEVRMMADDPEELSLAEIGRQLGVSRERARQLEARAKAKLKRRLEEDAILGHGLREEAA